MKKLLGLILLLFAIPACATPTLKRVYGQSGMTSNVTGGVNPLVAYLDVNGPNAVATGDLLVVAFKNPSGKTITFSDSATSTWNTTSCTDTHLKYGLAYASAAGTTTSITLTPGSTTSDISYMVYVFSGATSGGVVTTDGTNCKTAITGPTIANNAITTTVSGDLVVQAVFDSNFPSGTGSQSTGATWGTSPANWTGLQHEVFFGSASQYIVQASSGSITPSLTYAQGASDTFAAVAVAFEAGPGGAPPGTGIGILRYQTAYVGNGTTSPIKVSFPVANTGDAVLVVNEASTFGSSLTNVTDDASQTYTPIACTGGCAGNGIPQAYLLCGSTGSNNRLITLTLSISNNDEIGLYDITGAANISGSACLDKAATAANSSTLSGTASGAAYNLGSESSTTISDAASITPSTANGLIIGAGNIGTGPATKCASTGAPCTFDYSGGTWTGNAADNNGFANGDFMAHFYNTTASAANFQYTVVNNASSWQALVIALKAAPTGPAANLVLGGKAVMGGAVVVQ